LNHHLIVDDYLEMSQRRANVNKNLQKPQSNLSFSCENTVSYQKNKPSKQCTALNVFFHYRELINFTVRLRDFV